MEDLDYKDLFRDAIHTIAYIARAAGFDPDDPTVEPPAIIARIENQRAALGRLTAERAALLAPVEGVDLEEVLRRADEIRSMHGRQRTPGESARLIGFTSANATAAPALARALMAERATAAKQHDRLRAQEAHIRRLEAQEQRLMAKAEGLRLTLAAEQGRPEGAPPGWVFRGGMWRFDGGPKAAVVRRREPDADPLWQWEVWGSHPITGLLARGEGYAPTARAARVDAMAALNQAGMRPIINATSPAFCSDRPVEMRIAAHWLARWEPAARVVWARLELDPPHPAVVRYAATMENNPPSLGICSVELPPDIVELDDARAWLMDHHPAMLAADAAVKP